jgi:hypothetical protein
METVKNAVGLIVAIGFIAGLLFLLWAIIRFSIFSRVKTRGAHNRIRKPESEGISSICGFELSEELIDLYRNAEFIERTEFYLVNRLHTPPQGWFIGGFFPLSSIDVKENRKVSHVSGIPIADDLDKGVYYVSQDGTVLLDAPNRKDRRVVVAPNIAAFAHFEPTDKWNDNTN